METPSSTTRRITRLQNIIPAIKSDNVSVIQKVEESKQRALIDITNDSPIVGLTMGKLETPSSLISKNKRGVFIINQENQERTLESGETLLRDQVNNLLQKVEEEEKEVNITKFSPHNLGGGQMLISPNGSSENSNVLEDSILESQSENEISLPQVESDKDMMITRSLLLDFSEKSSEEDSSSIWSIQVNASNKDDHESDEDEIDEEQDEEDYYFDEEENDEDGEQVDELCDAINKIDVNGNGLKAKFCGKRVKFVYNSDDELEREEEVLGGGGGSESAASSDSSGGGLRLQGWPTPIGTHIRFPEEAIVE